MLFSSTLCLENTKPGFSKNQRRILRRKAQEHYQIANERLLYSAISTKTIQSRESGSSWLKRKRRDNKSWKVATYSGIGKEANQNLKFNKESASLHPVPIHPKVWYGVNIACSSCIKWYVGKYGLSYLFTRFVANLHVISLHKSCTRLTLLMCDKQDSHLVYTYIDRYYMHVGVKNKSTMNVKFKMLYMCLAIIL